MYIKPFKLLYADYTLIIANSPGDLQHALNCIEMYCQKWKLDINCAKTKIVEKVKEQNKYNFMFQGEKIEIVNEFKYLAVTFTHNGAFNQCILNLKSQAKCAMFSLIAKSRKLNVSIDIQSELFDMLVLPILLYGSEVWGYDKHIVECEKFHCTFIRYILKMRNNTCDAMVYGESGRLLVAIEIKR